MEKALNHIKEELLKNGEFIIPNLGRFFLHDYSSSINKFTKDSRLRGSTINFEHDANAQPKKAPAKIITDFSAEVLEGLNNSKTFSAGMLGNFFINSSKQITFLASPKINLSKETFGFTQVRVDEYKKDWLDWLSDPEDNGKGEEINPKPLVTEKKEEIKKESPKPVEKLEPVKVEKPAMVQVEPKKVIEKPELKTEKVEPIKETKTNAAVAMDSELKSSADDSTKVAEEVEKPKKKKTNLAFKIVASVLLIGLAGLLVYFAQDYFKTEPLSNTEKGISDEQGDGRSNSDLISEEERNIEAMC